MRNHSWEALFIIIPLFLLYNPDQCPRYAVCFKPILTSSGVNSPVPFSLPAESSYRSQRQFTSDSVYCLASQYGPNDPFWSPLGAIRHYAITDAYHVVPFSARRKPQIGVKTARISTTNNIRYPK